MSTNDTYAIRLTNDMGTWWWTGHLTEDDPDTGLPPVYIFGWTPTVGRAKHIGTLRAAIRLAQRIDSGLHQIWPAGRVQAVLLRYSAVRGWVQCDAEEPQPEVA